MAYMKILTPQEQIRAVEYKSPITSKTFNTANLANYPEDIIIRFYKEPEITFDADVNSYQLILYPFLFQKDGVVILIGDKETLLPVFEIGLGLPTSDGKINIGDSIVDKLYIYVRYSFIESALGNPATIVISDIELTNDLYMLTISVENNEIVISDIADTLYFYYSLLKYGFSTLKDTHFISTLYYDGSTSFLKFAKDQNYMNEFSTNASGDLIFSNNWGSDGKNIIEDAGSVRLSFETSGKDGYVSLKISKKHSIIEPISDYSDFSFDASGQFTCNTITTNTAYIGNAGDSGSLLNVSCTSIFDGTSVFNGSVVFNGPMSMSAEIEVTGVASYASGATYYDTVKILKDTPSGSYNMFIIGNESYDTYPGLFVIEKLSMDPAIRIRNQAMTHIHAGTAYTSPEGLVSNSSRELLLSADDNVRIISNTSSSIKTFTFHENGNFYSPGYVFAKSLATGNYIGIGGDSVGGDYEIRLSTTHPLSVWSPGGAVTVNINGALKAKSLYITDKSKAINYPYGKILANSQHSNRLYLTGPAYYHVDLFGWYPNLGTGEVSIGDNFYIKNSSGVVILKQYLYSAYVNWCDGNPPVSISRAVEISSSDTYTFGTDRMHTDYVVAHRIM